MTRWMLVMLSSAIASIFWLTGCGGSSSPQGPPPFNRAASTTAIENAMAELTAAINTGNGDAFAALFTDDGNLYAEDGATHASGASELAAAIPTGVQVETTVEDVSFLSKQIALAHVRMQVTPQQGDAHESIGLRIMQQVGVAWKIRLLDDTPVLDEAPAHEERFGRAASRAAVTPLGRPLMKDGPPGGSIDEQAIRTVIQQLADLMTGDGGREVFDLLSFQAEYTSSSGMNRGTGGEQVGRMLQALSRGGFSLESTIESIDLLGPETGVAHVSNQLVDADSGERVKIRSILVLAKDQRGTKWEIRLIANTLLQE